MLSICIPTYNRRDLIGKTLESIIPQLQEEVEIVVCDNGSTDDTQAVVESYRLRIPSLRYFRFDENQGVDRCFIQSVALANNPYCWLMGSDDQIEEGSVQRILEVLHTHPGLAGISVNMRPYDAELKNPLPRGKPSPFSADTLVQDFALFFPRLYIYAGYLSGQVVNKALWQKVVTERPVEKFFNCYALVYIITHMVQENPCWFYIDTPCVGYRADNDSFLDRGAYKRLAIDIEGFSEILLEWFPRVNPLYKKTMEEMAHHDIAWRLLKANVGKVERGFWQKAWALCWKHYACTLVFWKRLLPLFFLPAFFWKSARLFYRLTFKKNVV